MRSSSPLESRITANIMATARGMGWYVIKMHGSAFSLKGTPDVLALKDGRAVWMEVKRPGQHPTKVQQMRMLELEGAGCPCATVRSPADARTLLEEHK